jgi:hypothetical protein
LGIVVHLIDDTVGLVGCVLEGNFYDVIAASEAGHVDADFVETIGGDISYAVADVEAPGSVRGGGALAHAINSWVFAVATYLFDNQKFSRIDWLIDWPTHLKSSQSNYESNTFILAQLSHIGRGRSHC